MASSKEYLNFVLENLSDLEDITHRAMMGEFIIYYKGKKYKLIAGDSRIVIDELDWVKSYKMEAVGRIKVTLPKEEIIIDDTEIK